MVSRRLDFIRDQYRDSSNLKARAALHARFSTNPYPWFRWFFDHMDLPPGSRILEVGCGPGDLWDQNRDRLPAESRIFLTDLSEGMVREARTSLREVDGFRFAIMDAGAISLSSSSVNPVVANQMLSHVPKVGKALEEIWRVLRPGGRLYAGASGRHHMRELFGLLKRFDPNVTWSTDEAKFEFETAPSYLKSRFKDIKLERFDNTLLVTEPGPIVDYVYSMSPPLVPAVSRKTEFYTFVVRELEEEGAIKITRDVGIITATKIVAAPPTGKFEVV